jgi:hypothetical protein
MDYNNPSRYPEFPKDPKEGDVYTETWVYNEALRGWIYKKQEVLK